MYDIPLGGKVRHEGGNRGREEIRCNAIVFVGQQMADLSIQDWILSLD